MDGMGIASVGGTKVSHCPHANAVLCVTHEAPRCLRQTFLFNLCMLEFIFIRALNAVLSAAWEFLLDGLLTGGIEHLLLHIATIWRPAHEDEHVLFHAILCCNRNIYNTITR